ncbi:MAG: ribosome recycling factor [Rickettsiales bacterium]
MTSNLDELKRRMEGAIKTLHHDFSGLRTGRASVNLLDGIQVEAYGSYMPITQMASLSAPEPRLLTVQVWDKGNVKAVEKAIANAGLGLNPMADGQLIRVPLPELSEERRKELAKIAAKFAENARVAVRNVRRDGMDALKKDEKDKVISEDEHKKKADEVQKATDLYIKKIDETLAQKEKDIMQV